MSTIAPLTASVAVPASSSVMPQGGGRTTCGKDAGGRGTIDYKLTLSRPYTQQTFGRRLKQFNQLIGEITLKEYNASPAEKRQLITGRNMEIY